MIYLLFGEMGIGKNYIGTKLARKLSCNFFDGDEVIPKDMAEIVNNFKSLNEQMLDNYVNNSLIPAIRSLHCFGDVVVAQALYLNKHRRQIVECFGEHNVKLIYIYSPFLMRQAKHLIRRPKGFRWLAYWLLNKPFFQAPYFGTLSIENNYQSIDNKVFLMANYLKQMKR